MYVHVCVCVCVCVCVYMYVWMYVSLQVGAVVVGYDDQFSYMKMFRSLSYLSRPGCIFIGTNEDSRLPTKGEIKIPGW